ncbi:unnamed protein product [Rhizoctonia solani]|uniref:5'-3' exoribonuclease 1 D1 domain-containing protein n=1 Tax=Rhizoctonia solani TaxID=456999 RepID=A0A8H3DWW4_9AGAM|nr:unnamed protein product [Rhizoctonia solani]
MSFICKPPLQSLQRKSEFADVSSFNANAVQGSPKDAVNDVVTRLSPPESPHHDKLALSRIPTYPPITVHLVMDDILGLALRPVVSCSAPASRPLASSANISIQKSSADRIQLPIVLDFRSDRGERDIRQWCRKQPTTRFTHIEYRKDTNGHFKHEFVVARLDNSTVCRFDRRAREDARGHALKDEGTASEDSAHVITLADTESKARLDESEVLMSIELEQKQNFEFLLAVCHAIQLHPRAKSYSLLQYNCYFFSWTLFITTTRRAFSWTLKPAPEVDWRVFADDLIRLVQAERVYRSLNVTHVQSVQEPWLPLARIRHLGRSVSDVSSHPATSRFNAEIDSLTYEGVENALRAFTPSMLSGNAIERVLFRSHVARTLEREVRSVLRKGCRLTAEEGVDEGFNGETDRTPKGSGPWYLKRKAVRTPIEIHDELVNTIFSPSNHWTRCISGNFLLNEATRVQNCIQKRMLEHFKQVESYGFGKAEKLMEQAEESMTEIWVSATGSVRSVSISTRPRTPRLREGVFLGADALAGFPSLQTLPHSSLIQHHSVNVFNSDSKNRSVVIRVTNTFTGAKAEPIAEQMIGKRTYIGWPFLMEAQVVAVSDDLFKYERQTVGRTTKVVPTPHHGEALSRWKRTAEKIATTYSKRFAVEIGDVDILLHVRPLKGLKRQEDGALVKDYAGPEAETEQAVQMSLMQVKSEDPRYVEQPAAPLEQEYPIGTNVFFLGVVDDTGGLAREIFFQDGIIATVVASALLRR